jgi:hypothetical protein
MCSSTVDQKYCLVLYKDGDELVSDDAQFYLDGEVLSNYINDGKLESKIFGAIYTLTRSNKPICVITQDEKLSVEQIDWFDTLEEAKETLHFEANADDFENGCYDNGKFLIFIEADEPREYVEEEPIPKKYCLLVHMNNGKTVGDDSVFYLNDTKFRYMLSHEGLESNIFPEGFQIFPADEPICVLVYSTMKHYFFRSVEEAEEKLGINTQSMEKDGHMLFDNEMTIFTKAVKAGDSEDLLEKPYYLVLFKENGRYIARDPTGLYKNTRHFRQMLRESGFRNDSYPEGFDLFGTDKRFCSFPNVLDTKCSGEGFCFSETSMRGSYTIEAQEVKSKPLDKKYYLIVGRRYGGNIGEGSLFLENNSKEMKKEELLDEKYQQDRDYIGTDKPVCVHMNKNFLEYWFFDSIEEAFRQLGPKFERGLTVFVKTNIN